MKILVTGPAGFIGFHLAKNLLERGDQFFNFKNLNNLFDVQDKVYTCNIFNSDD